MAGIPVWRSPEELVSIGFERSRVVMMNEAHSGLQRCIRTREIGRRILPAAHQAGVRHMAMEALMPYEFAEEANRLRCIPDFPSRGYLAQPEMRLFIQAALDLGWILIPYEADIEALPAEHKRAESANRDEEELAGKLSEVAMERINWREAQQALNLTNALNALPSGAKLLVWCGWGHHARAQFEEGFTPMGYRFCQSNGTEFFGINQVVTVDAYPEDAPKGPHLAERFAAELTAHGGTAGFLTEESPIAFLRNREDHDAFILSTQNELV